MKIVAIVPIKQRSTRVKNKNFKKINNKPLYRYLLDKLSKCNFDEVFVDSDSNEIREFCKKKKFTFIPRIKNLSRDNANGNDLLNYHSKIIEADLYFQLFITAPLLKVSTINNCIKILRKNRNHDSIMTVRKIYSWFWYKNKPVNYKPSILPRSQDAIPIIQETTGLYGIRGSALKKYKCRIGKKPFLYEVDHNESIDLDTEEDFFFLKYLLKKFSKI